MSDMHFRSKKKRTHKLHFYEGEIDPLAVERMTQRQFILSRVLYLLIEFHFHFPQIDQFCFFTNTL